MTAAVALLEDLTRRGVTLTANGDRLHWKAKKGVLTDDLREAMALHKSDLLPLVDRQLSTRATDLVAVAEMYVLGTHLNWCELPIAPGVTIKAGEDAWTRFLRFPPLSALAAALEAAKNRTEEVYPF